MIDTTTNLKIDISHTKEIFSVTRLNREVRIFLEGNFPYLWIEGEISNFVCPNSGHWYFSLKDNNAQVRCVMFKTNNKKLNFKIKDGMHVIIKATITLYEGRGDFQLLVDFIEEAGEGKLQREFEALKKRLDAAGLFDLKHKKSLPLFPKKIGIITSPTGAAIRDILSVISRRYQCVPIVVYPTLVQGELAASNVIKAIQTANRRDECDVLIVARGGGSLEDLWPFNEERVAYSIYNSTIPIITGIGHEIDYTIADFVADLRAPTPSAAAELVVPNCNELKRSLEKQEQNLLFHIQKKFSQVRQHIEWINKHFHQQHPKRKLSDQNQHLDLLQIKLLRLFNKKLNDQRTQLHTVRMQLAPLNPCYNIQKFKHQMYLSIHHLNTLIHKNLEKKKNKMTELVARLNTLNPLSTLERGFSITTQNNKVVYSTQQIDKDVKVSVKLFRGELRCSVDEIIDSSTTE